MLGELLTAQMLPETIKENDRWKASFIYWKLRKQEVAIKALLTAPIDLENNSSIVDKEVCVNRSFLVEDPALLYLYNHLRNRNLKYFIGSLNVEAKIECTLILRVTDILCRMGLQLPGGFTCEELEVHRKKFHTSSEAIKEPHQG